MITVPTERPDADAPTPQDGVEQTAADQARKAATTTCRRKSSALDTVASVVDGITDVVSHGGGHILDL